MPDPSDLAEPAAGGITSLEALRATIREALLVAGDALAIAETPASFDAIGLESLVNAYRGLGGDLELVRRPAPGAELLEAVRRLADATEGLTLEDFPPRLQDTAIALNGVLTTFAAEDAA